MISSYITSLGSSLQFHLSFSQLDAHGRRGTDMRFALNRHASPRETCEDMALCGQYVSAKDTVQRYSHKRQWSLVNKDKRPYGGDFFFRIDSPIVTRYAWASDQSLTKRRGTTCPQADSKSSHMLATTYSIYTPTLSPNNRQTHIYWNRRSPT